MMLQIKYIFLLLSFLFVFTCLFVNSGFALETIPVEGEPIALAVDEAGGRLFSLNHLSNSISVIDEKKLKVVKTIELGKRINRNVGTSAIYYDHSLNKLFLSTGNGEVLIFHGSSLELMDEITIKRFIPDLASDGDLLYLLDWSGNVHKYGGNQEAGLINHGYVASPYMHMGRNNRLYLSSGQKGLIVIDTRQGEVLKKLDINAYSTPASSAEYIFVAGPGRLYIINKNSHEIEKNISLNYGNTSGLGLIHNPLNGYVYVVTEDNTVTIVDPGGVGEVVRKIDVCEGPRALAINNKTGVLYVACLAGNSIDVISN